jgi:tRNA-dihydrouridine synthase 1
LVVLKNTPKKDTTGAILFLQSDWPHIEAIGTSNSLQLPSLVGYLTLFLIVSNLSTNLSIPIHVKLRLCIPPSLTVSLAVLLARAGASVMTLHARHVAPRHRRKGAAELKWVQAVKSAILEESGLEDVIVLSNGNVRTHEDCEKNLKETGADGVMVGEAMLGNPR